MAILRTFIAVDFPPEILQKFGKIIAYFKTQTPENTLKWVSTHNLHLTIKFLGDIPLNKLDQVKAVLSESLQDKPPFTIGIEGLGLHPDRRNPRVIWLGITSCDTLTNIYVALDRDLTVVGIEPDKRKYTPHITIARVKRRVETSAVKNIGETLSQFKVDSLGNFIVKEIILYQSELTPKGPIYTPLMTSTLNKV